MTYLQPSLFIIPIIALSVVIVCYIYYAKKASDRKAFKQLILAISMVAFLANFAWEVLQGPFYSGYEYDIEHISFCALASVADVLMVLILYFGLTFFYKNPFWIKKITLFRLVTLILIGGIGAILGEIRHLTRGSWSYADSMPTIPIGNVGLLPVLQFMILPVLIYGIAAYFLKNFLESDLSKD